VERNKITLRKIKSKKMKKLTQKDRIIRHLNDKGSITALEAMKEYGIMRLTSRICELKDEGYNIKSEFVSSKNRYNEPVSFSKYSLA
tara:strand:- start:441 stop:701 length:261 start_codon:yes stop_codon:yes gene_type:complete